MSWNKAAKKDDKSTNLIVNNQNADQLSNSYFLLLQKYESIKDYDSKLDNIDYGQYKQITKEYHNKMIELPNDIANIRLIINKSKKDQNNNLDENAYQKILVAEENLKKKENDLQNVLNSIVGKERALSKRFSILNTTDGLNKVNELNSLNNQENASYRS